MLFADLHCDLLYYLGQNRRRSPENDECRCSSSLLKQGKVALQTLAVYTETAKHSTQLCARQFEIFQTLPHLYPQAFRHLSQLKLPKENHRVSIVAAIENASGLCDEEERLEKGFERLDSYMQTSGPLLYISLTWNHENRFGGGNLSKTGLKRDGQLLLDYLNGKHIAIDLSHTSDALAEGILEYIEKKNLRLTPIASHSNFRAVSNQPRNLTDQIAKEIVKKGGVIGLNFVKAFVGKTLPRDYVRQIEHAKQIGVFNHLVLGADFFYDKEIHASLNPLYPFFYEPFGNSSCYPDFFKFLGETLSQKEVEQIGFRNLENFFFRENEATP